jgi:hypothetical protein
MGTLLQGLKFGLRMLAKNPCFTAVWGYANLEESPDLQFWGIKNRKALPGLTGLKLRAKRLMPFSAAPEEETIPATSVRSGGCEG